MPEVFFVGTVAPGTELDRTFVISTHEPELILSAVTDEQTDASLATELIRIDGRRMKGTVHLTAPTAAGAFHSKITIPVEQPESKALELTISGYVLEVPK